MVSLIRRSIRCLVTLKIYPPKRCGDVVLMKLQIVNRKLGQLMNEDILRPYFVGAGIGLLSCFSFYLLDMPLGITTTFAEFSGALASLFSSEFVESNSYFQKNIFRINYGLIFVMGTMIGAFISAHSRGAFRWELVPVVWQSRFGGDVKKRFFGAVLGGFLTMFGARLAGGCTSGHGISGGLQLAVGSWVFFAVVFLTASLAAHIIYNQRK
jgi:uncharacterized membrane protein YedE/YeeE